MNSFIQSEFITSEFLLCYIETLLSVRLLIDVSLPNPVSLASDH